MFFSPVDCSFVPTVSLQENDNSQPVAGGILPHTNHVFLPNMLCPTQPVAGCIFPHNHVFSPNVFVPNRSFLCSNCVCWKMTICNQLRGVYFHTNMFSYQTCFPIRSFFWSNCVFAGKRQFATSCGLLHNHVFSPNVFFPNHLFFCSNCVSAGKR